MDRRPSNRQTCVTTIVDSEQLSAVFLAMACHVDLVCLSAALSVCLQLSQRRTGGVHRTGLSVSPSVRLSIRLSVCLFVRPSVHLSVSLSVCGSSWAHSRLVAGVLGACRLSGRAVTVPRAPRRTLRLSTAMADRTLE
jgi:hypothetical protein